MTSLRPVYVGIDLGTTNSAAATFDGERVELVRNAQGATLTPSVVRIDARGRVAVGARAAKMLDTDPENVRGEFKRLMGTAHVLPFPGAGVAKRPAELSAAVLGALRDDIKAQVGVLPERAVISVPALFELPQTAATSEAAQLAGFERVELIQEPVASAIAAGWKADESPGPWLVYDLGGGTFDVSLLETQEGLLRIVGHDGDNFLGGRDFDGAVVDWAIEQIAREEHVVLDRANPAHGPALRRLRAAAEEAKIELSRGREAEIQIAGLTAGDRSLDVSLVLDRGTLERLVEPLVMRSLAVCERLLAAHGLAAGDRSLARIVLVGGPTAMPLLRERVAAGLGAPFGDGLDSMTLVAQGAALFAASAGLDARPSASQARPVEGGVKVWLQYPAVSSDTSPYLVGKVVDPADRAHVAAVVVARADGTWTGPPETIDAEGTFAAMMSLAPRTANAMRIEGRAADGRPLALAPSTFSIVHGVTIGDPPLARSVGIALASNGVRTFFERGSPLPMRRTFSLRSAEALAPGDPDGALRVPIVQGEFPFAHLCRLVGVLEIPARTLAAPLPAASLIDVTIDLDRGGRLTASARIAQTAQVFDQVIHLVAGSVPVAELAPRLAELGRRVATVRARAFNHGVRAVIEKLADAESILAASARDEEYARGGDIDSAEKVRRQLVDLDALVAEAEALLAWPDLDARAQRRIAWAVGWVGQFGTSDEKKVIAGAIASLEKGTAAKNTREIERQMAILWKIGLACWLRSPGAWEEELDYAASRAGTATDPRKAARLVDEGRAAAARDDGSALERAVRALWQIMPEHDGDRLLGHSSGVR